MRTQIRITNVADRVNICVRTTVYMNICVLKKKIESMFNLMKREH